MSTATTIQGPSLAVNFSVASGIAVSPATASPSPPPALSLSFQDGTAVGQCNRIHFKLYTIAGAGNTTVDLTSLTDPFGNTFTDLVKVRVFCIFLQGGTAYSSGITIGNAATPFSSFFDAATDTLKILNSAQGAPFSLPGGDTGHTVDGTHKLLKIVNADATNAANFYLLLAGTNA